MSAPRPSTATRSLHHPGKASGHARSASTIVLAAACVAATTSLASCAGPGAAVANRMAPQAAHGTGALLSQEEATSKAVAYLNDTEYGEGRLQILGHIKDVTLMKTGRNDCGAIAKPVWAFHVHARFEGWLYLDAASGDKVCSSLPFLR